MALSKVNFNSMNVTPAASKAVKFNSSNNGLETGDLGGNLVLISTQTASSSSTISFTSGIDSTYKEYVFKFINIHPATDGASFTFQTDTGTNTSYNQTVTTSFFQVIHAEGDGSEEISYNTGNDLAQSSSFQILTENISSDNDHGVSGTLHLFEPSSTTFVKHFMANPQYTTASNLCLQTFVAGYFNTTTAITRLQFKMSSGNIDAGTFKLYGVL
jgi:hypothetical protein